MPRTPTLTFDRGTLLLHPPPKGKDWMDLATWDDRVEKFRIRAIDYRALIETLQASHISFIDKAKQFSELSIPSSLPMTPYPHQEEALLSWKRANRQGVVVLPTAAGKTYLAQLAIQSTPRTTLIIVPTVDLLHQWYSQLLSSFPNLEIGLLGGGSKDRTPILISTYHSAAIHSETLGNQYALLIFDECHHLPTDFFRKIAEDAIAPYRLGLTATPERTDGAHETLDTLIGTVIYQKSPQDLSGQTLAKHEVVQIKVKLSTEEQQRYDNALKTRNNFLRQANISLGSLNGWQLFVKASASSSAGRRAMLAHRESKDLAAGTSAKLGVLEELIAQHYPQRILIFTQDNATVYKISQQFLIPAITHQTKVKERHKILTDFREGRYKVLAASQVLNEGVDVPEAQVAIILSGTGSSREFIQRLGRILRKGKAANKLAILYEVIADNTTEEQVSRRRRGESIKTQFVNKDSGSKIQQLELISSRTNYPNNIIKGQKAAETSTEWSDLEE